MARTKSKRTKRSEASYLLKGTRRQVVYFPDKSPKMLDTPFSRYYKTRSGALKKADALLRHTPPSKLTLSTVSRGKVTSTKKVKLLATVVD